MIRQRITEETERHHIVLFKGDYDALRDIYPTVSPSLVIRRIVRTLITNHQAKVNRLVPATNLEVSDDFLSSIHDEQPVSGSESKKSG